MKIPPVEAELFHAGGRTDVTDVRVAFRTLADALQNEDIAEFFLISLAI